MYMYGFHLWFIARLQQGIQGQLQQYPNANAIRPARSALAVPVYACEASLQGQG